MTRVEATVDACDGGKPLWRRETVSLEPASAYEAVTRQMVIGVSEELREIKARLNGLLFMVAGSVLLDVALRLTGGGS